MIKVPRAPQRLRSLQHWFASIISRRIDQNSSMQPIAPSGALMEEEAKRYIAPSPTLTSHRRIEIYNQQYWWRLLNVLHDSFPFVVRLFGYSAFNEQIGFPYLEHYRPNHWSLSDLGVKLPLWIKRYYLAQDKQLIYHAVTADQAFNASFVAPSLPPLSPVDLANGETFFSQPLALQPHIFLFSLPYHLFEFRDRLLETSVEYWTEEPFPEMRHGEKFAFMVWRDRANQVGWIDLDPLEYILLAKIQRKTSLGQLCNWAERQSTRCCAAVSSHLQQWAHRWTINGWVCREDKKTDFDC